MILVTGYKGYIGSKVYTTLLEEGYEVLGLDLKDGEDILYCLPDKDFDYVFHLAALPRVAFSVENPFYTFKQNALVTSRLLEWSKNHNVKRFIFSSSAAVYGNGDGPNSPYGLHKLLSEQECKLYSQLYGLDTVCLRYFNVFSEDQQYGGAYSTVVSAWMEMIKTNQPLRIDGDGEQSRDYIHVEDIVNANLFCMKHLERFNGNHYDVGTGISVTLNDIKKTINQHHVVAWQYSPERMGDVKHTLANTEKLKKIGWHAIINPIETINNCFKENKGENNDRSSTH